LVLHNVVSEIPHLLGDVSECQDFGLIPHITQGGQIL
jgi:hypothetical protein